MKDVIAMGIMMICQHCDPHERLHLFAYIPWLIVSYPSLVSFIPSYLKGVTMSHQCRRILEVDPFLAQLLMKRCRTDECHGHLDVLDDIYVARCYSSHLKENKVNIY